MTAIYLSLHSKDFLLPYSLDCDIHPIAEPRPPFGDIKSTDPTNTTPVITKNTINNEYIFFSTQKNKDNFVRPFYIFT